MRNRAKCLVCNDIIESLYRHHYIKCSCGEIAIDGGPDALLSRALAANWDNFRYVEDDDTEVPVKLETTDASVKVRESDAISVQTLLPNQTPTKEELLQSLELLSNTYRDLPQGAKMQAVTHSDLHSFLDICLALFRSS